MSVELPGRVVLRCGDATAEVHPDAAMLISSWVVGGTPVLAQLASPEQYARHGTFTGIPLMYPWANRLAEHWVPTPDGRVELPSDPEVVTTDPTGLPLHGAHPSLLRFDAQPAGGTPAAAPDTVTGVLRWGSTPGQRAVLPLDHTVTMTVTLTDATLRVDVTVAAGDLALPVSFGLHPYLRLDTPSEQWRVALPERTPVVLDERQLPTGELRARRGAEELDLDGRPLDDGFVALVDGATFAIADASRAVSVTHVRGYPCAQVYAPVARRGEDAFVCLEPMTAPTNALQTGSGPPEVSPGGEFTATCVLRVEDRDA